ncbi:MAG: hypothetical protein BEN19_07650 [Epulopiscium sp. Nuni2H_MBin003]|nr:MAG: hypothetical protein BEN19_07650 [Epulopiscium sp. Nuni2H_MBin003]
MKKVAVLIMILISFCITMVRIYGELLNYNFQVGIRYEDALNIADVTNTTLDQVLHEFKELGITTIMTREYFENTLDLNIIPIMDEQNLNLADLDNISYIIWEGDMQDADIQRLGKIYGLSFVEFYTNTQADYRELFLNDISKIARLYTDEKVTHISTINRVDRYELAFHERTNRILIFTLDENGIDALRDDISLFIENITSGGYVLTQDDVYNININNKFPIIQQILALLFAIVIPIFAICTKINTVNHTFKDALGSFLEINAITILGAIVISSILSGGTFRLGIDTFRGVKVAHIAPIIILALIMLVLYKKVIVKEFKSADKKAILVVGISIFFVLYIYIRRTGNSDIAMLEMTFREWLGSIFGIRPRTKEFLIGHPALIIGLYCWVNWIRWLGLLIGIIGQISIINTFVHMHTPFMTSMLRTGYGIILGVIVGILAVKLIFKVINRWIIKQE